MPPTIESPQTDIIAVSSNPLFVYRRGGDQCASPQRRRAAAPRRGRDDVEFGSWFRSMNGQDQASAGVHTTIAMLGATGESGGAFIMAAGTTEAHLMVP